MANTSDSSIQSIAPRIWDSTMCLVRDLATTGDCDGVLDFEATMDASDMRATPPSWRMDVGRDAFEGHDGNGSGGFGFGCVMVIVLLRVFAAAV